MAVCRIPRKKDAIHPIPVGQHATHSPLTGRVFDADLGERYGVVNYGVGAGEGPAKGIALAQKIAGNAPMTAFAVMHELPRIVEMSPAEGLFTESLMASAASNTPEAQERLRAFLEGRAGKVVKE